MISKQIADDITLIAKKQLETSRLFRQPRIVEILDNEDVANLKTRPTLQGRLNIPFDGVFMNAFIDSLVAETNRPPKVEFQDPTGANLKGARKVTAAWERDSKKMRLRMKDRSVKRLAALSGRGILKYYAESDPKYCPHLQIIDHLDFHCEPNGGGYLDDHYFHWQENIFRAKEDIKDNAGGFYDQTQVEQLINSYDSPDFKRNVDTFNNKGTRYATLGLDIVNNNFVGGTLFNLVEGDTFYKGIRYHLIWDQNTGIWLRCVPLKEDFGNDLTPFVSFASPQEDAFNFWQLGPCDKVKPVFESIRLNLNEILNNNRKRNWDMKAVDAQMFPDIRKLDWRQDGIVHANVPLNQSIQNGIYRFETPEINGALNLNVYLNNLIGEKSGVTAATLGAAAEDKVGIYQGNQLQISKRMKLISDSYEEMYEDLGYRYDWGLWDHADEDEMVKLISTDGIGWEKITKEDKDPEYMVSVISSSTELAETDEQKKVKIGTLTSVETNPILFSLINPKAHLEEKYRLVGYDEEKIKKLLNTKADVTDELLSEAKKAVEMILEGKEPDINYGATTGFLQYISDWILDNADDLKPEQKKKLEDYFEQHVPIAIKNEEHKQFMDNLALMAKGGQNPLEEVPPDQPPPSPTGAPTTPPMPL